MKSGMVVLVCLIPVVLIGVYSFYVNSRCIAEAEAEILYKTALDEETSGKLKESYLLFKKIDTHACENYELRGKAFNKAVSLRRKLDQ